MVRSGKIACTNTKITLLSNYLETTIKQTNQVIETFHNVLTDHEATVIIFREQSIQSHLFMDFSVHKVGEGVIQEKAYG